MLESAIQLTLPKTDFYKLNVDVKGPNNDGNRGLTAIICDTDECVVAAACWFLPVLPQSGVAEGQALLKGGCKIYVIL
jgi:hypothetical protein